MTTSMGCELAHLDAAYVLGALSPEERLEFERHLPGCPDCTRAVGRLAGLPGLLAQVSPEVLEPGREAEPVPETLLPTLVRTVRRRQVRRRWLTGVAAAAAVLVVGAGTAAVVNAVGDDPAPSVAEPAGHEMRPVGQDSVVASVALTSVAWGTKVDLVCSYDLPEHAYGGPGGSTYTLVVRSREGEAEQVGTWNGLPGKTMTLTAATALARDDIAAVEVWADDGHPILELTG